MNRSLFTAATAAATGIALVGSLTIGIGAAGADPLLEVTAGASTIGDGAVLEAGQEVVYSASGCLTPGGAPGYVGIYTSFDGDPAAEGPRPPDGEVLADAQGNFQWVAGTVKATDEVGTIYVRSYCASSPVTSWNDPAMLYGAELMRVTTGAAGGANQARAASGAGAMRSGADAKQATSSNATVTSKARSTSNSEAPLVSTWVDPNALPSVDRIDITGPRASALKTRTDLVFRLGGDKVHAAPTASSNRRYVKAAYLALGLQRPSTKMLDRFAAKLDDGQTRVRVVEEIALAINPKPAAWNGTLRAGLLAPRR